MLARNCLIITFCSFTFVVHAGVVDAHVHMPSALNFPERPVTVEQLIESMDLSGIDKAFVLSSAYSLNNPIAAQFENEYVSKGVRKYPSRLFGFCGIYPIVEWAVDEVKRCQSRGMVGMKIHTNASGMNLSSEDTLKSLRSVFELANEYHWIVLIHSGQWSIRDFMNFIFLTNNYPQAKFILGHGLFEGFRNLVLMDAARKEAPEIGKNLFLEVSGLAPFYAESPDAASLLWHLRKFGMDRVLFGSDFPIFTFQETLSSLVELGLTPEEIEQVTITNFKAILP